MGWFLSNVRREQEGRIRRTEPGGSLGPWTPLVSWTLESVVCQG